MINQHYRRREDREEAQTIFARYLMNTMIQRCMRPKKSQTKKEVKKTAFRHLIVKVKKAKNKILKAARGIGVKIASDFSMATMEAKNQQNNIFNAV